MPEQLQVSGVSKLDSRTLKIYICVGFSIGLLTPVFLVLLWRVFNVPPMFFFAFWPTVLLLLFESLRLSIIAFVFLVVLANGLIYALAAGVFRQYSVMVFCGIVIVVAVFFTPPSQSKIVRKFSERRSALEELRVAMQSDEKVRSISPEHLTTIDGKQYSFSDTAAPLSRTKWQHYSSLFKNAGVDEIVKGTQGDFFVVYKLDLPAKFRSWFSEPSEVHSFTDGLAAYDGYVFCRQKPAVSRSPNSSETPEMMGDLVCFASEPSKDLRSYSYSPLGANWYSLVIRRRHGPD
jgi:hypothetical protein